HARSLEAVDSSVRLGRDRHRHVLRAAVPGAVVAADLVRLGAGAVPGVSQHFGVPALVGRPVAVGADDQRQPQPGAAADDRPAAGRLCQRAALPVAQAEPGCGGAALPVEGRGRFRAGPHQCRQRHRRRDRAAHQPGDEERLDRHHPARRDGKRAGRYRQCARGDGAAEEHPAAQSIPVLPHVVHAHLLHPAADRAGRDAGLCDAAGVDDGGADVPGGAGDRRRPSRSVREHRARPAAQRD
ncbi:hypothetical protein LTR94_029458, partial [Friedmanniomyces endolithicus]